MRRSGAATHWRLLCPQSAEQRTSVDGSNVPFADELQSAAAMRQLVDFDVRVLHDGCPSLCLRSNEVEKFSGEPTLGLALSLARTVSISLVFIIALISVLSLLTIDNG